MKPLLIFTHLVSFVKQDLDSLKAKPYRFNNSNKAIIFSAIKLFFYLILFRPKKIYVWFNDYHAFLPCLLFPNRVTIFVGGYDAMSIPEIRYGIFFENNIRSKIAKFNYWACKKIIFCDKSLIEGFNEYRFNQTGVAWHVNFSILDKSQIIPFGVDTKYFKRLNLGDEYDFIMVANIPDERTLRRKGVDVFVQMAKQMPEYKFCLVGLKLGMYYYGNVDNLIVYPFMKFHNIRSILSVSKVFCQLSIAEGQPNTLLEAMACECVPVGTSVNGIPDTIGDTGVVIDNVYKLKGALLKALEMDGAMARKRVIKEFSMQRRINQLEKL